MAITLRRGSWGVRIYVGCSLAVALLGIWFWAGCPGVLRADHVRALREKSAHDLAEALPAGRIPNYHFFTRVWLPRAALINSGLALALAAAWPVVRRRLEGRVPAKAGPTDGPVLRRVGWCAISLIAGLAAWANEPRLGHSLWGDEENTMRKAVVGVFASTPDTPPVFVPVSWSDTLFHYKDPNNHVLYSLTARCAHLLFAKRPEAATDTYFSEWALRLPAYVAGGLAVFSIAGLGAAMGWRRAGWIAAVLLVLHPWFVRYSTEARGYAFLLAGFPALLTCFLLAARTGRWRWWMAAGALEWALLYTWPLSAHGVLAANLCGLGLVCWRSPWSRADRLTQLVRWGVTSAVAAMALMQLFLPHLMQLRAYLLRPRAMGSIDDGGVVDATSALFTGRVWQDPDPTNPLLTPWLRVWHGHAALVVVIGAILTLLIAVGVLRAWRDGRETRILLVGLAVPPLLMVWHSIVSRNLLLPWYLVPCLPGVLTLLAGGIDDLAARMGRKSLVPGVMAAGACALFAAIGVSQREVLRTHPIEPNREAALLVQPVLNPYHPDYRRTVLTGGFLMQISAYDPGVLEFKDAATLRKYLGDAEQSGRDFAVTYGLHGLAHKMFPEVMGLLEDPRLFQHVATLHGLEPFCTRHVYRHPARSSAANAGPQ
jgi:Dolichyl-phosphate-mannose-protein mannosyltransferase